PIPRQKAKPTKETDEAAGSSGRLTPSGAAHVAKSKKSTAGATATKRAVPTAVGAARSRSTSEMPVEPAPAPKPKPQPEEDEELETEEGDDKLYCICKTSYDEDRVMIACDRCDEWYHTQCLGINDLEVDLIDQFVCPPCIEANPDVNLKTTYKQRCMAGLKHPHPSSSSACHKPSRGAFSKFCSDECGIAHMQQRIEGWGGDQAVLWASVRDTKQREGVVVKVHVVSGPNGVVKDERRPGGTPVNNLVQETLEVQRPRKTQRDRLIARLQVELDKIGPKREKLKEELEIVFWRQKLLTLAGERSDMVDECGWDQRLCFDDDEYMEFGAGVLESYEEGHAPQPVSNGDLEDPMQVDGQAVEDGEWWCRGEKVCPRHSGWRKLRASEFDFDQELKEKTMGALTTQEREIRKQLEDAMSAPERPLMLPMLASTAPNGHALTNGSKPKANGVSGKKGKQKK
ncbi:uncharacterized protein BXZ73DRAFT_39097, partial [Epithele typhae]|uniref:uncharacterized protein n=1 Tax=Epithele typhae TaxID=378194 RepID=UPI002008831E